MKHSKLTRKYLYLVIASIISLITFLTCNNIKTFNKETNITMKNYNVYLETSSGSGTYSPSSSSIFPTSGYIFNAEKSKCVNGLTLSYNNEKKTLSLTTDKSDKCNIYFDK